MSCRHCRGLHCDGCRDRGGSVAALAGLAVIIALAVPQVWPRIAHAVEIAAWTTAALTGTVITVTAGVWLTRISRRRARRAAERTAVRRQAGPVISAGYQPGYRVIPGPAGGRPAISTPRRPARLSGSGCCERWTPEDGCPAGHTGRPAMSLRARAGWPDRRGQR